MQKIDYLAYKIESFESDAFIKELVELNPASVIFLFNQKGAWLTYAPKDYKILKSFSFTRFNNLRLDYFLYPVLFLIDHLRLSVFFLKIFFKFKVRVVLVENTHLAAIIGVFRRLNLFQKMVYLPGDWLAGGGIRLGIWSWFGNDVVFPIFDYLACSFSDLTLNCTNLITQSRFKYWGKKICQNEIEYVSKLILKADNDSRTKRRKILFIGTVRDDSGLEIPIKSLDKIRKEIPVGLKIIGTYNQRCFRLRKLSHEYKVKKRVEFLGYLEREKFKNAFADCFCGINLLTTKDGYTTKTNCAKIFDYLQYLLPLIVTENVGPIAKEIKRKRLGVVIKRLTERNFSEAVFEVYQHHQTYQRNILKYLESFKDVGIEEILLKHLI